MLSYKKLDLDVLYDTVNNDIVEEFYKPVLGNATDYVRASCYFSLDTLLILARPLGALLKSGGVARFVMSFEMSEKDFEMYKEIYLVDISKKIVNEINAAIHRDEDFVVDIGNIGYLIKMGLLQVKIALKKSGIFHEKFGIASDSFNNKIGFIGSLNETVYGIKKNTESVTLRKSYSGSQDDIRFLKLKHRKFEDLWDNESNGHEVYDLPVAIEEELIKVSNENYIQVRSSVNFDHMILNMASKDLLVLNGDINAFTKSSRIFNMRIKPKIKCMFSEHLEFKRISGYIKIKRLILLTREQCERTKKKLIIGNELKEYLLKNDIYIEKRRELGTYIKNRDPIIVDKFNLFSHNLNKSLKRPLKQTQLWDAFHTVQMVKSSNYSVPGTGKTAMILGAFAYLKSKEEVSKLIVCGPLNSRKSWRDEIDKVFHDYNKPRFIDVKDFNSSQSVKDKFFREGINAYDVIFINHEALSSLYFQLKNYNRNDYFICIDEVHKFKGNESQRAKLAIELFTDNRYKSSLTGTPIPNGFQDFYSQLNILYTHEYDTFFSYSYEQLKSIGSDPLEIEKFNNVYQPFFCRTTKSDLNIKPPLKDIIVKTPMSNVEAELYDDIRVRLYSNKLLMYIRLIQLTTIPESLNSSIDKSFVEYVTTDVEEPGNIETSFSITKLPPAIIEKAKSISASSKIQKTVEVCESIIKNGRNAIVWAIFISTHEKISLRLSRNGIKAKIINGTIGVDQREEILEEFKRGEFDILIANPHTMAESVSLHQHCHDAIYVEYDFNLTHNLQSRDRIHRLGLSDDVETRYYYLVSTFFDNERLTADQYIYNRLSEKRELMLQAVESDLIHTIPVDDIMELLNLII